MVVIVNESTVNTNPKMLKYKNLAAFALGKAPSLTGVVDKDGKPVVNYNYVNFLPDKDTINAVINGDMSAKKVIKKAIKALRNPSTENQAIGMTVVHLVHMITDEYRTKNQIKDGPSVLAFILDDPDSDEQKATNKFLTRYVTAVFQEFGFDPVTNKKTIKKLFDGNRKKRIKKVAKYIKDHDECRMNKDGYTLKKILLTFYAIPLHQASLNNGVNIESLKSVGRKNLVKALYNAYTNCNMIAIGKLGMKSKIEEKYLDRLRKMNKKAFKMYNEVYDIMEFISDQVAKSVTEELTEAGLSGKKLKKKVKKVVRKTAPELPKIKFGHKKKTSDPDNVKMNAKKFKEFFEDKDNVAYLAMIYAHTTLRIIGVEIGCSEYCKFMSNNLRNLMDGDVLKLFISTAKGIYKDAKADKPQA